MGIKLATKANLNWVNGQYQKIGFIPSELENETVAIVMYNEQYAGVGRIVYLNEQEAELGGIYILDKFRGLSLAYELVDYLVTEADKSNLQALYCLPFEKLKSFYSKFDFKEVEYESENLNRDILKKYRWCNETYDENVLLLKR
ncbi:acetyltransferase [Bacillus manliponensis]|uniref:Acetyltransferase n=1 Tax=Bacillus manliponensis TaxID=574376 RepID=A0A073JZI6_9BACI|nr:GNAT family N-acetyltransferase [Bacillus manliponensis]KEK19706.1 acetyltransferase [Bacillus manliponensis]